MHLDFTITWVSIAAFCAAAGSLYQVGKGVKVCVDAVIDLVTFCKRLVTQHEQMWKAHCSTYELDERSGLPLTMTNGHVES